MGVLSVVAPRLLRLPPPVSPRVRVDRDVTVVTGDGVPLRADHYAPVTDAAPTVLIRTPYGRRGGLAVAARTLAEQGFHVFVQGCRGTFDSGGTFAPMRHERDDGLVTLDWLRGQPWYSGELCMFGPSYVGFTQWAMAADAGPDLKAMVPFVTASQFRDPTYAGGAFSLDTVLTWAELMSAQRVPRLDRQVELWRGQPSLRQALAHLPLSEADAVATGAEVRFVREWLHHTEPDDPYWRDLGHGHRIGDITAAVLMIGGWHDIFLPWELADYAALRAAGRDPELIIGSWHHGSVPMYLFALHAAVAWFRRHTTAAVGTAGSGVSGLAANDSNGHDVPEAGVSRSRGLLGDLVDGWLVGDRSGTGSVDRPFAAGAGSPAAGGPAAGGPAAGGPVTGGAAAGAGAGTGADGNGGRRVRVHVGGVDRWRSLSAWPPVEPEPTPWYLHPSGRLDPAPPGPSAPDRFRYDPADPTPNVGGPLLMGKLAGRRDNRDLESRSDVLVYTGPVLAWPLEVIGPVVADIRLRSTLEHFDVFVRLCDVDINGRSYNVCDGLVRVAPGQFPPGADGIRAVRVELWPTAYQFPIGHRPRVQVSGGSHPRYARNPGTGEPLATATRLVAGERDIFHDPDHPSAVFLPVVPGRL